MTKERHLHLGAQFDYALCEYENMNHHIRRVQRAGIQSIQNTMLGRYSDRYSEYSDRYSEYSDHRERITAFNLDKRIISEFSTANPITIIYDLI